MNIFDSMGEPKEGIKFQRVEDFKKQGLDYVELNHKKGWGISLKEIELEENKLHLLETLKKGLMQNMFV